MFDRKLRDLIRPANWNRLPTPDRLTTNEMTVLAGADVQRIYHSDWFGGVLMFENSNGVIVRTVRCGDKNFGKMSIALCENTPLFGGRWDFVGVVRDSDNPEVIKNSLIYERV